MSFVHDVHGASGDVFDSFGDIFSDKSQTRCAGRQKCRTLRRARRVYSTSFVKTGVLKVSYRWHRRLIVADDDERCLPSRGERERRARVACCVADRYPAFV